MRLSLVLLVVSAAGLVGGAWLVGPWMVGLAIMAESIIIAAYALIRDVPVPPGPALHSLPDVLERYRDSS